MENGCHIALINGLPTVINASLHWYVCVIAGMMLLKEIYIFLNPQEEKINICSHYWEYK